MKKPESLAVRTVRRMVRKAALELSCPTCLRPPGYLCWTRHRDGSVSELKTLHLRRLHGAFESGKVKIS